MSLVAIPSAPGYLASPEGDIFSCRSRWAVTAPRCLLAVVTPKGYLRVRIYVDSRPLMRFVHDLVLEAFSGPRPPSHDCRHADGNKKNNAITNLCWGTRSENEADKVLHGTRRVGEQHSAAKLTDAQMQDAVARVRRGESQTSVARSLGVSQSAISLAVLGKRWKHLRAAGRLP